jgi:hypothetical protein
MPEIKERCSTGGKEGYIDWGEKPDQSFRTIVDFSRSTIISSVGGQSISIRVGF